MNFVEDFVWYNLKSNFYNTSEQSLTFLSFKWIERRHTKMFLTNLFEISDQIFIFFPVFENELCWKFCLL